jgi:hypothetical protein
MTRFIAHFDTARDYTLQFTITHTNVHSNVFIVVAWQRLPTTDLPLPLGSRTLAGLSYQLLTATESQSRSYVTTDGQSASLSWCQAPIWGLRPDFYCCQTAAGLLMWGVLSPERTGLPFTIAAGPRQRSHS